MVIVSLRYGSVWDYTTLGTFTEEAWKKQKEVFADDVNDFIAGEIYKCNFNIECLEKQRLGKELSELQNKLSQYKGEAKYGKEYKELKSKFKFLSKRNLEFIYKIKAEQLRLKKLKENTYDENLELYFKHKNYFTSEFYVYTDPIDTNLLTFWF